MNTINNTIETQFNCNAKINETPCLPQQRQSSKFLRETSIHGVSN